MEPISTTIYSFSGAQIQRSDRSTTASVPGLDSQTPSNRSNDRVTLSPEGKNHSSAATHQQKTSTAKANTGKEQNLSDQELEQLRTLQQRDAEVRNHEQAHLTAAGQYARGGASFTMQRGPDGASYAVGGEVNIDISEEATAEETISKMQTIKRAALAPMTPSSADRTIAAQASVKESLARQQLAKEMQEGLSRDTISPAKSITEQSNPSGNSYGTLRTLEPGFTAVA